MAQTTELAPKARAFYRRHLSGLGLNKAVHTVLEGGVNAWASAKNFSFPAKFSWEWKLEMLTEKYEIETVKLFADIIKPGDRVVDIGAHIGFFSRMFSRLVGPDGKVFCFEADPDNYALLIKNTAALKNVMLFNSAIADKNGTMEFFHLTSSTGCHSLVEPETPFTKISVAAVTLDSLVAEGKIDRVDLIKIDIEGGEPFALSGMEETIRKNPKLQMVTEYNAKSLKSGGIEPEEYLVRLQKLGFQLYGITETGLIPFTPETIHKLDAHLLPTGYINVLCKQQ